MHDRDKNCLKTNPRQDTVSRINISCFECNAVNSQYCFCSVRLRCCGRVIVAVLAVESSTRAAELVVQTASAAHSVVVGHRRLQPAAAPQATQVHRQARSLVVAGGRRRRRPRHRCRRPRRCADGDQARTATQVPGQEVGGRRGYRRRRWRRGGDIPADDQAGAKVSRQTRTEEVPGSAIRLARQRRNGIIVDAASART